MGFKRYNSAFMYTYILKNRVFPFKSAPDPQAMHEMQRRVEQLQGKRIGPWNVTCILYNAKQQTMTQIKGQPFPIRTDVTKELFLMNFDDAPLKAYLIARDSVLEADKNINIILEKTKLYQLKYPIEVKGHHYTMGDFVVKFGTIFTKDNSRGTVMELEYCPSVLPNQCNKIMDEILALLGPFDSEVRPTFDFSAVPTLPEVYSHQHTAVQYTTLFKNLGLLPKT